MIFSRRKRVASIPEVGSESPKFALPSAQGGQLRLSMRTVRGPVVVVFYRPWSKEDVEYFRALSGKEEEINMASASVVGIGVSEPGAAREFARESGIKSYVLYDYAHVASREWGLLEKDKEHGAYSRPAVFIVSSESQIVHAWIDERPEPDEILAKISEITGLPKPPEEDGEEKPKKSKRAAKSESDEAEESKKPSPEEREKRRAERKAAREAKNKPEVKSEEKDAGEDSGKEGNSGKQSGG